MPHITEEQRELLEDMRDWLDGQIDADMKENGVYVPNQAMRFYTRIVAMLTASLPAEPAAGDVGEAVEWAKEQIVNRNINISSPTCSQQLKDRLAYGIKNLETLITAATSKAVGVDAGDEVTEAAKEIKWHLDMGLYPFLQFQKPLRLMIDTLLKSSVKGGG